MKRWGGCETADVLRQVGLEFDALFPDRPTHHRRPEKRPFPAADVLRAVASDAIVVAVAGSQLGSGRPLTEEDRGAVITAAARIAAAVEESGYA